MLEYLASLTDDEEGEPRHGKDAEAQRPFGQRCETLRGVRERGGGDEVKNGMTSHSLIGEQSTIDQRPIRNPSNWTNIDSKGRDPISGEPVRHVPARQMHHLPSAAGIMRSRTGRIRSGPVSPLEFS